MVEIPPCQDNTELPISKIDNVNVRVEELSCGNCLQLQCCGGVCDCFVIQKTAGK